VVAMSLAVAIDEPNDTPDGVKIRRA